MPMLLSQGPGGGLHGPTTAAPGSTVPIYVGSNDSVVEVKDPATGEITPVPVGPGKSASITVPNRPGGVLVIRIGSGGRARVLFLEITSPGP